MNREVIVKFIATLLLILMCTQYIPLEGWDVSYIKVGAMGLTPLVWLIYSPKISKVLIWGGLYFIAVIFSALFNPESFRISTIGYLSCFILMFITFYNLIYCEKAFSIDYFIRLLKGLILAFAIVLVVQQIFILFNITSFSLINLMSFLNRGIGANSLSLEPSHSARILTVIFLVLIRMYETKWGKENITLQSLYVENRWVIIAFLWTMMTMGSGTAYIGLAVISLYFVKRQFLVWSIPLLVIIYISIPYIDFEPLQRAKATFEAALTLDQSTVIQTDGSAAVRVVPIINTLTELDLTDIDTWFGNGVDSGRMAGLYARERTIGGITEYGLISYIIAIVFIFNCCIRRFFSLEFLIFFLLLGGGIGNIAYIWGCIMLMTTARYFTESDTIENEQ